MASSVPPQEHPITRDGSKLVISAGAKGQTIPLPPFCVKCGAPASGKPVEQGFRWHPRDFEYFFMGLLMLYSDWLWYLPGRILGRAAARISGRWMTIAVQFCPHHARKRSYTLLAARAFLLTSIAGVMVVFNVSQIRLEWICLPVVGGVAAKFLYIQTEGCGLSAESVDQDGGIFSGCGEAFLQQFPPRWKPRDPRKTSMTSPASFHSGS